VTETKLALLEKKRKLEAQSNSKHSSVKTNHSVSKSQTNIINNNKKAQDRGVKYKTTSLWSMPNMRAISKKRTAANAIIIQDAELDLAKALKELNEVHGVIEEGEDEDEEEEGICNNYSPDDEEEEEDDPDENTDTGDGGDDNAIGDEDEDEVSDDEEEEILEWKEVQRAMAEEREEFPGRDQKIKETKQNLKSRWKDYVEKDGIVQGEDFVDASFAKQFVYRDNLPPFMIAQVSLMKLLSMTRSKTLTLFDRIIEWVTWFSQKYPGIFSSAVYSGPKTRKTSLKVLTEFFAVKNAVPVPKDVILSDGRKLTVPVFDFVETLKSLLLDPDVINDDNLIQENFDKKTWRPTKKYRDMGPNDRIDDLNTGYLMEKGIELYCNGPVPVGVARILPLPLIFFSDESHHDTHGGNKTSPVSVTLGCLNVNARSQYKNWRNLSFQSNKSLGQGKSANTYDDEWVELHNKKRGKKTKTQESVRIKSVKDYQTIYGASLEGFERFCRECGGFRMMYKGECCIVKPFSLMTMGDNKEYNIQANHFNCSGSRLTSCLSKDMMISFLEIGTVIPPPITPITLADHAYGMENEEYAKRISRHRVAIKWDDIPVADTLQGHAGQCPTESLHLMGQGAYKDGNKCIHNYIGKGATKKAEKESVDLLFKTLTSDIQRCAERSLPTISSRAAAMDLSRLTGDEQKGNFTVLNLSLETDRGRVIMKDTMSITFGVNIDDLIYTMSLLQAYDEWTKGTDLRRWELDNAEDAVGHLMQCMIDFMPQELTEKEKGSKVPGSNGYHKVKFLGIWLIFLYMRKYGTARCFDGQHGERFHIQSVKMNGDLTQGRNASFSYQVAVRDGESNVIELAYSYVRHLCPQFDHHEYSQRQFIDYDSLDMSSDDVSVTTRGEYHLICPQAKGRLSNIQYQHKWKQSQRVVMGIKLNDYFLQVLSKWAIKQGYTGTYCCQGFTELSVKTPTGSVIYRANEYFYGSSWYDWALVQDPDNDEALYIAKILGFVRYKTRGFPTYNLVHNDGMTPAEIDADNAHDNTLYAIVRGSRDCYDEEKMDQQMYTRFQVNADDSGYIIPVSCIKKPLLVTRNIGSPNSMSYIRILPQYKWHLLFRNLIKKKMEERKKFGNVLLGKRAKERNDVYK